MSSCIGIRAGRFRCSVLIVEVVMTREVITDGIHACWTTSGEVCRVQLRVGRFVELD